MKRRSRQWRPQRRPSRPSAAAPQRDAVEQLARALLADRSVAELEALVAERQLAFDEADRLGQAEPSPQSLIRYRAARSDLEAAQRALELARRESETA